MSFLFSSALRRRSCPADWAPCRRRKTGILNGRMENLGKCGRALVTTYCFHMSGLRGGRLHSGCRTCLSLLLPGRRAACVLGFTAGRNVFFFSTKPCCNTATSRKCLRRFGGWWWWQHALLSFSLRTGPDFQSPPAEGKVSYPGRSACIAPRYQYKPSDLFHSSMPPWLVTSLAPRYSLILYSITASRRS